MLFETVSAVKRRERAIPARIKPAINGSVSRIRRHYQAITGINRSQKFFYSEGAGFDHQRTLVQRMFVFYQAVAFTSRLSASLLDEEFRSWSHLRRRLTERRLVVRPADIWNDAKECASLLANINIAWGNFDKQAASFHLVMLKNKVEEMIESVNMLPDYHLTAKPEIKNLC